MEFKDRLTHKRNNGIKQGFWTDKKKDELVQRLGEYEETGLSPNEILTNEKKTTEGVMSNVEFALYLSDIKEMVMTWKKEHLGYLSRRQQLVDVILGIQDQEQIFTVGQLKEMFAQIK